MYTVRVYRDNRQIAAWEQPTEPVPTRTAEPLEDGEVEAEDIVALALIEQEELARGGVSLEIDDEVMGRARAIVEALRNVGFVR